ncbi:uncharacterized protein JCM15063_001182 [Sporobolomyces koalae]|uniref:uncharacterized protein n=1 Tax=Sporobolomyces koalae TaxID=500713 RepID=UPI00317B0F9D
MADMKDTIELSRLPAAAPPQSADDHGSIASLSTSKGVFNSPTVDARELDTTLSRNGTGANSEGLSLPPVDRGRGAWTFVLCATLLEAFIWGFGICFSVILVHLETHEPWSNASLAALSSIGTIQLGLMFFLTFFVNNAFRRYPEKAKLAIYISAATYPLSLLLSSFATQVWQLILLQGILGGISGAILYGPVLLWSVSWFHAKRGLASGIIFSGTGFGGAVFPFLLGRLLDKYGFAWTCRIWAIICAVVFGLTTYFIRPRIPPTKPAKGQRRPKWFIISPKVLNHPINWTLSITTLLASLAYFPVSLYLPLYTQSLLYPSTNSFTPNLVVAVFNLVAFVSSTAIGWASDKSLSATATFVGVAGAAVALGAWGTATDLTRIFFFAAIFGATTPISSYWGAASREIGGSDPFIAGFLLCQWGMIRGLASIVAPFISTGLYDEKAAHSNSDSWGRFGFQSMIIFVGVMSFVSSFGGIVLGFLKMRSNSDKRKGVAAA